MLALAILGTSMLLRLATFFGVDGNVITTLSPDWEGALRLTHRLAASGVGLLAIYAVILFWARRPLPSRVVKPIAWLVATTVFLAVIGPLTSGYRITAVTVGNVVGGMVLLMAFVWLRESVIVDSLPRKPVAPLLRAALFIFLLHVATGAATSAHEMHGIRWFAFVHLGTALLSTMFIGAALWARRDDQLVAGRVVSAACLMGMLLLLGFAMTWLGARPVWLTFAHGMLSPLLAIPLVSMAARDSRKNEHGF
jgi:heme A synthase